MTETETNMTETAKPKRPRKPYKRKGTIRQEFYDNFMDTIGNQAIAEGHCPTTVRSAASLLAKQAADKARPTPRQMGEAKRKAAEEERRALRDRRGLTAPGL